MCLLKPMDSSTTPAVPLPSSEQGCRKGSIDCKVYPEAGGSVPCTHDVLFDTSQTNSGQPLSDDYGASNEHMTAIAQPEASMAGL